VRDRVTSARLSWRALCLCQIRVHLHRDQSLTNRFDERSVRRRHNRSLEAFRNRRIVQALCFIVSLASRAQHHPLVASRIARVAVTSIGMWRPRKHLHAFVVEARDKAGTSDPFGRFAITLRFLTFVDEWLALATAQFGRLQSGELIAILTDHLQRDHAVHL
jgi:hypothetical protein